MALKAQKKETVETISATELRNNLGNVLKRVHVSNEPLLVERDGLPVVAILSRAEFEEYRRMKALDLLEKMSRQANRELVQQGYTEEQMLDDLAQIKKEVFQETYGDLKPARHKKTH